MPDLIIKPAAQSGNKVIIQDQAGGAVVTTADSGATIANATLTSPTINTPTIATPTISGAATFSGDLVPSTPLSNRNLVINGGMRVSQRATTTAPTPKGANDDGYYLTDRWRLISEGSTPSRFNLIQASVTDLAGFDKAMQIDCTTASASPGSDDGVSIWQRFEGQDFQSPGIGLSGAKPMTASFYVKGTAGKTIMFELYDRVNNKIVQKQIGITASWVRHEVLIPAITSGSVITSDTARRVDLGFWLHVGSQYTGGTYNAETWKAFAAGDRGIGVGAGIMSATSDELYITGVQLELGSNATPFEHRRFGDELVSCQRYCIVLDQNARCFPGRVYGGGTADCSIPVFPVEMRATPTHVQQGTAAIANIFESDGTFILPTINSTDFVHGSKTGGMVRYNTAGGVTNGAVIIQTAYNSWEFNAEL